MFLPAKETAAGDGAGVGVGVGDGAGDGAGVGVGDGAGGVVLAQPKLPRTNPNITKQITKGYNFLTVYLQFYYFCL